MILFKRACRTKPQPRLVWLNLIYQACFPTAIALSVAGFPHIHFQKVGKKGGFWLGASPDHGMFLCMFTMITSHLASTLKK